VNLADIWEAVADRRGEQPALVHGAQRTPFAAFDDRAARLAAALADHGIGRDAKVAMYLYNANEYLETTFAALKLRAVPVNVNYRYLEDELFYLLENSDAEALVFHGALAERVRAVRDRLPKLRALVQVTTADEDRVPLLDAATPYEDLIASSEPAARIERSPEDVVFLYTGGTTGLPKAVIWPQAALYSQFAASYIPLQGWLPATPAEAADASDRLHALGAAGAALAAAPLMHGMAWFTSMARLMIGGTVVSLTSRTFDPHEFWRAVQEHRVNACTIVGDAFARPLVEALEEAEAAGRPYDLSSLGVIISGGVMWTPPYKQPFVDRGVGMLIDGLGSSEATGAASHVTMAGSDPSTARFQLGPHTRVLTEDGREVTPGSGEVGVLAVGGPAVAAGYYKDPQKSAQTFRVIGGQRYSIAGDYATVEEDGSITLLGRGSVCINTGGEKVFPEEVEEVIKLHPAVADCVVVGVPDEKWGQAITALVALRQGGGLDPAELLALARQKLAAYKAPKHVVVVPELLRSPAGKADYRWALDTAVERLERTRGRAEGSAAARRTHRA
jgi:acyl-CoA synthetase (AMP-forming)/AMP-acid ligase II